MGDDASARKHYGTGLGLTITKQYIETLGGKVEISSKLEVGTAVDIQLPIEACDQSDLKSEHRHASILIATESNISASERLLFEHHDIDVVTMPLEQAIRANLNDEQLDLMLISSDYADREKEISKLKELLRIPFVSYESEIIGKPNLGSSQLPYSTTIRPGIKDDIKASLYLLVDDVSLETMANTVVEVFNILVADDNEINLATARLALESAGHHVNLVNNGESALEALASEDYDLVFMDMHMPGMNGIEVVKIYGYETDNPAPIILLTADVTDEAKQAASEAHVTAMLSKPILPNELRKAVAQYARRHPSHDEINQQNPSREKRDFRASPADELLSTSEINELSECGASTEELLEMVDIFESDAIMSVELAIEAANENRYSIIRSEMHSLRGAAGALGAIAIQEKAHTIEVYPLAANGISVSTLEDFFPVIEQTVNLLKETIELHRSKFVS